MAKQEFGQLSHYWSGSVESLVGKFGSRKYNGFSLLWDGGVTRGMLATDVPWYYKGADRSDVVSTGLWSLGRNNKPKVVRAPELWLNTLPLGVPLHGELWNNDDLEYIKKHARTHTPRWAHWSRMQFLVFGVKPYCMWEGIKQIATDEELSMCWPAHSQETYLSVLRTSYLTKDPYDDEERSNQPIRLVRQTKLNSLTQVLDMFTEYESTTWEGLMFANLNMPYETQRSYNCLKYKPKLEMEGTVTGYEEGKTGKNIGKVGAIEVAFVWDEKIESIHGGRKSFVGQAVSLCISGLNDEEREWSVVTTKYPVGSTLSFTFLNVSSNGIPQSSMIDREVH